MVISDEVKFPKITPVDPFKTETKVKNVDTVPPVEKIGNFRRQWQKNPERRNKEKGKKLLTEEESKTVRSMVEKVNKDLTSHNVLIHLVLTHDDDGFSLDVYDCTDNHVCKIVKDIIINVDDLPVLIRNLQQEVGLLIDTVL